MDLLLIEYGFQAILTRRNEATSFHERKAVFTIKLTMRLTRR